MGCGIVKVGESSSYNTKEMNVEHARFQLYHELTNGLVRRAFPKT